MNSLWIISHAALWVLVLLELACIIALARQVGLLSMRIGPTGARTMNVGPEIGSVAPAILTLDIDGREVTLGVSRGRRTLLAFVSPVCSTCVRLVQALCSLQRSEKNNLDIILMSSNDYDLTEVRAFAEENHVTFPYVVSSDLSHAYNVQNTPYAVLVDAEGIVRAKGLVNHLEHLESLLNAEELGHATLEDFVHARASQIVTDGNFQHMEVVHDQQSRP